MADTDIGAYDPKTAKMILDVVRYLKKNGYVLQEGNRGGFIADAPRVHIAKVVDELSARDEMTAGVGTASLTFIPGKSGTAVEIKDFASAVEVNVYNMTESPIPTDTQLPIVREFGSGKWLAVPIDGARRIAATLIDGNPFNDPTASDPHTASSIEGINTKYNGPSSIDVYNPLGIKLWDGIRIFAEWNITDEQWQVYAATSDRVLHHVRHTEDCNLEALNGADGWFIFSDANWVTSITVDGCQVRYATTCDDDILAGEMDYITSFGEQYCKLFAYTCQGNEIEVMDFGKFVTAVYKSGSSLYYQTCFGTNVEILPFSDCGDGATCGTCGYIATMVGENLQWVSTDSCTGTCECVAPPVAPVVVGQTWFTNCEEP